MALTAEAMKAAIQPTIEAALRAEFGTEIAVDEARSVAQIERLAAALAQGVADGLVPLLTNPAVTQVVVGDAVGSIQ